MTKQGSTCTLTGGVATRRSARIAKQEERKRNEVDDLAEKMTTLNVGATNSETSRPAQWKTSTDNTNHIGVLPKKKSPLPKQGLDDLDVGKRDMSSCIEKKVGKASAPLGLENPANMCYANSVLQALLFTSSFVQ